MENPLISEASFLQATQLSQFKIAAKALMDLTKITSINNLYATANKASPIEFIESVFDALGVEFEIQEDQLKRIPKVGPFISISNHPLGGLDGLLLIYIVSKIRPDFKVMANFILQQIGPLQNHFIAVNPFENRKELASSFGGVKEVLAQLQAGNPIGIFPAGEVSSFQTQTRNIADKKWKPSVLKLIRKAEVPIVPIYFKGSNSLLFHFLGIVHPNLRTLALPSELMRKRSSKIQIRIGRPIPVKDQEKWDNITQFGRFLRAKTYSLDSSIEVSHFFKYRFKRTKKSHRIVAQQESKLWASEIKQIQDCKLLNQAEFDLYLAPSERIPFILNEIGRLREITFREVGEGTQKSIDLDEYDLYYQHLFLYDRIENRLVGSYRIGKGNDIYSAYGKKGFYLHSLFKLKNKFSPILAQSIEMGRSFIVADYQKKRLPLFLLWKGILQFALENKEYRYLIGPVSISGSYTKLSRMIIVEFIRRYYYNPQLAEWVEPRSKFKIKFGKVEGEMLVKNLQSDMREVDHIISDCEPNHMPVPVLLKKYLKQNAKIIGFNKDPNFNNTLDGLIVLDLLDLTEKMKQDLMREL